MALFDKPPAKVNHLRNIGRGPWFKVRAAHVQSIHVFMKCINVRIRNLFACPAFFIGAGDDFVIHVGEVADKGDIQPLVPKIAGQHVEHHGRSGVPDMRKIIGGNAAGIHADFSGAGGNEFFFFACFGIVKLHGCSGGITWIRMVSAPFGVSLLTIK